MLACTRHNVARIAIFDCVIYPRPSPLYSVDGVLSRPLPGRAGSLLVGGDGVRGTRAQRTVLPLRISFSLVIFFLMEPLEIVNLSSFRLSSFNTIPLGAAGRSRLVYTFRSACCI